MANWLGKLLNVRPNEWSRLLFMCLILILTNLGYSWGMNTAYAVFLKPASGQSGLETLIWVLLFSSVLSIPALGVYSAFTSRIDSNRLYAYMTIIVAIVILFCLALMSFGWNGVAFPLLYVLIIASFAILNPHFFTYMNELYDIQAAKRILPLILAAGRIGAVLAGFSLQYLTANLPPIMIIWLWFGCVVVVTALIFAIPSLFKEQKKIIVETVKGVAPAQGQAAPSYWQNLQDGWNFTIQTSFLRWMAIGTVLVTVLMTIVEYYTNRILAPEFSQVEFAGFLGQLEAISNLVALVILIFGISRMTKAWGVGNTSLIFPVTTVLSSAALAVVPAISGVFAASFAHINRRGLRVGFQASEALLYNAIPFRIKGRARAFVGGLVAPAGAILGVLLLLINQWYGQWIALFIPALVALLAIAYLISSFFIRREYTKALVKMLEEEDYSFLLSQDASELMVADAATLQRLQKKLTENTGHEMQIFLTQLIAQVGGAGALSILIPALKSAPEARTRAAMLSVLTASGLGGDKVRELYMDFLGDPDPQVRQAAASGLEQLLGTQDPWFQSQLLGMANDPDTRVSVYALQSLANSGEFYKFNEAVQKLDEFTRSDSVEHRKNAIDILGKIARPQAITQLLSFLDSENDQLRLEAILEMENMTLPTGSPLDEKILAKVRTLFGDPVARVRQSVLKVTGKFKFKTDYPLFLAALGDSNNLVRATAVNILVEIGKDVTVLLQNEMKTAGTQSRKMLAVTLARINPRQFSSLIEDAVTDNLLSVYQNVILAQAISHHASHASARVLLSGLKEINHELMDEVLYILSAVHNLEVLRVIKESLTSDVQATRVLAVEALESLTSPKTASLVSTFYDPSAPPEQVLKIGQELLEVEQIDTRATFEKLITQTDSPILAALAAKALSEMGLAFAKRQEQETTPINTNNRAAKLLRALEGATEPAPAQPTLTGAFDVQILLAKAVNHPDALVKMVAKAALEKVQNHAPTESAEPHLTRVDRIILLKETPFFRNVPVSQLETLAAVSDEKHYDPDVRIFNQGEPGGVLYILISGQVSIEQEKRGGSTVLSVVENGMYFGEMSLFDHSPRSSSAIVKKGSYVLELGRAPIVTLTMQYPDLALEFINVLSQRMRETSDRMAEAARSRPRELHKLFDQFG